jgi:hypothetical protein
MKILSIQALRGPNIWSVKRKEINPNEIRFGRTRRATNKQN